MVTIVFDDANGLGPRPGEISQKLMERPHQLNPVPNSVETLAIVGRNKSRRKRRAFVQINDPRTEIWLYVIIATPTATSHVLQAYVQTLLNTRQNLKMNSVRSEYVSIAFSEVHTARNILAAQFLANAKGTHVFFINSDMSLPAALCLELLATGKDLVGAAYPKRTLDMKKLEENLSRTSGNFQDALT